MIHHSRFPAAERFVRGFLIKLAVGGALHVASAKDAGAALDKI